LRRETLLREDHLLASPRNTWFKSVNGRSFAVIERHTVRARASVFFPENADVAQFGHMATDDVESMQIVLDACCTAARERGYLSIIGPQGALRSAPSGVGVSNNDPHTTPQSLYIPSPQPDAVSALHASGFTLAASGNVWVAEGADLRVTGELADDVPEYTVRTMQWATLRHDLVHLADVMNVSFQSRPMHQDIGGADMSLMLACLRPVIDPSLTVLCFHGTTPVGAMIGLRDCALPAWCDRLPISVARMITAGLARTQRMVCVFALGIRPEYAQGRAAKALLYGVGKALHSARRVVTTWIDDENPASWLLARRIGMRPRVRQDLYQRAL
jgi:hypothetical protein